MKENGYEKYSRWFDIIQKKCDEMEPTARNYYELDNGICVKTEDGKVTWIFEKDYSPNQFNIYRDENPWDDEVNKVILAMDRRPLIQYKENTPSVQFKEYQDKADLPSAFDGYYHDGLISGYPDLNSDMQALLLEAVNRTEFDSVKKIYTKGISFLDSLEKIVEQEKSKSEEKNKYSNESKEMDDDSAETLTESEKSELDKLDSDRSNDDKIFSGANDFTPDELEQMSTEDLEKMLKTTKAENEEKKKTLEDIKKQELISKIKAAVAEGKDLDAKIVQARNITKEK